MLRSDINIRNRLNTGIYENYPKVFHTKSKSYTQVIPNLWITLFVYSVSKLRGNRAKKSKDSLD